MNRTFVTTLAALCTTTLALSQSAWPTWRGPTGNGVAAGNPPVEWSEDANVKWKVATPGTGISTPIIAGDHVFLTTAITTDKEGKPRAAPQPRRQGRRRRFGRFGRRAPLTKIHDFVVLALNRKDGSVAWRTKVAGVVPHEAGHRTGSLASNSPVTDGEHVYAFFGSRGLYCLDMKGDVLWQKDLGTMRTRNGFGEGSSPALYGNILVVNWDHEGQSFVVAFNKKTGKELWRTDRDEVTSWSTPRVVDVGGRAQVIISATGASRGYDLKNGKVIWECSGMTTNSIPSPCYEDGVVYLMSGFRGASLQAIKLDGAEGNVEDGENLLWSHGSGTSYVPSALLYKGLLWFLRSNNGVLSCLDAKTGQVQYEGQRVTGVRSIYASPVGAAGRVYITSRNGLTTVIKAGPEYEEIASNQLDDGIDASLAIAGDEIYIRGRKNLYCIRENRVRRGSSARKR